MKRTNYALAVGILALLPALHSCKKAETETSGQSQQLTRKSLSVSSDIDYSSIGTKVENGQTILVFKSWEHFTEIKHALAALCVQHTEDYFKRLPDDVLQNEDILQDKITADNFNQFEPVHNFCATLRFQSYYQIAEQQENEWLKNSTGDKLDDSQDPFAYIERYESALFNVNGQVVIENETVNLPKSTSSSSSCTQSDTRYTSIYYDYKTAIGTRNRELKGVVGIRPTLGYASSTTYYKTKKGKWEKWFTNPCAEISGYELDNTYDKGKAYCNEYSFINLNNNRFCLVWGFYAYAPSTTNRSPNWAIKNSCTIKSKHGAPGNSFNFCF